MPILGLEEGDSFMINEDIQITVLSAVYGQIKLSIDLPNKREVERFDISNLVPNKRSCSSLQP